LSEPSESVNLRKPEPPLAGTPRRVGALKKLLSRLLRDTGAQDLAEYALLLVMVSLASVAVMPRLACEVACVLEKTANVLDDAPKKVPPGQQKKCSKQCS